MKRKVNIGMRVRVFECVCQCANGGGRKTIHFNNKWYYSGGKVVLLQPCKQAILTEAIKYMHASSTLIAYDKKEKCKLKQKAKEKHFNSMHTAHTQNI